jgi:capsule polysaccharide export protein KpsE/RkpR
MQPEPLFEAKARLLEAFKQRDSALDRCLDLAAQAAMAGQRIIELEAQVTDLQQQIETLKTKIPTDNPAPREES